MKPVELQCFERKSDQTPLHIAGCQVIGVVTQGRTSEEAKAALKDSVHLLAKHGEHPALRGRTEFVCIFDDANFFSLKR